MVHSHLLTAAHSVCRFEPGGRDLIDSIESNDTQRRQLGSCILAVISAGGFFVVLCSCTCKRHVGLSGKAVHRKTATCLCHVVYMPLEKLQVVKQQPSTCAGVTPAAMLHKRSRVAWLFIRMSLRFFKLLDQYQYIRMGTGSEEFVTTNLVIKEPVGAH